MPHTHPTGSSFPSQDEAPTVAPGTKTKAKDRRRDNRRSRKDRRADPRTHQDRADPQDRADTRTRREADVSSADRGRADGARADRDGPPEDRADQDGSPEDRADREDPSRADGPLANARTRADVDFRADVDVRMADARTEDEDEAWTPRKRKADRRDMDSADEADVGDRGARAKRVKTEHPDASAGASIRDGGDEQGHGGLCSTSAGASLRLTTMIEATLREEREALVDVDVWFGGGGGGMSVDERFMLDWRRTATRRPVAEEDEVDYFLDSSEPAIREPLLEGCVTELDEQPYLAEGEYERMVQEALAQQEATEQEEDTRPEEAASGQREPLARGDDHSPVDTLYLGDVSVHPGAGGWGDRDAEAAVRDETPSVAQPEVRVMEDHQPSADMRNADKENEISYEDYEELQEEFPRPIITTRDGAEIGHMRAMEYIAASTRLREQARARHRGIARKRELVRECERRRDAARRLVRGEPVRKRSKVSHLVRISDRLLARRAPIKSPEEIEACVWEALEEMVRESEEGGVPLDGAAAHAKLLAYRAWMEAICKAQRASLERRTAMLR